MDALECQGIVDVLGEVDQVVGRRKKNRGGTFAVAVFSPIDVGDFLLLSFPEGDQLESRLVLELGSIDEVASPPDVGQRRAVGR